MIIVLAGEKYRPGEDEDFDSELDVQLISMSYPPAGSLPSRQMIMTGKESVDGNETPVYHSPQISRVW